MVCPSTSPPSNNPVPAASVKMNLKVPAVAGFQWASLERKKGAKAHLFNKLQTSVDFCRSESGAGNDAQTPRYARLQIGREQYCIFIQYSCS